MERVEIISNFLDELKDKVESEISSFSELSYDERLQLSYNAIDHIAEYLSETFEKIAEEDKKELLKYLIKLDNKALAIKFSHILPLSEVIALYFANGRILNSIMEYYVEALNYML
jgi:predicted house-cleaning noncanonical NTP pyrophosphatase (MazG superfamily)